MKLMPRMMLVAGLAELVAAAPARAQPPNDSNISLSAPGLLIKKPRPGLPDVKAQPLAWPRLDAGAVLCRTETDLDRLAARRRGEPVDGSIECQIIRKATPISISQRKGPGKTEVKAADPTVASGWTDAWLPDKPPATASAR